MGALDGQVAVVTGASRGIGRACAIELAKQGANIVVNYTSNAEAAESCKAAIEAEGVQALVIQADVSNPEDAQRLIAAAEEQFGKVDILVAGVGTGGTITGTGRYLKEQNPEVTVVGVDPKGSIFTAATDADVTTYLIEGVGEDFWPETYDPAVTDRYEVVTDEEAFRMTRRLAREEGILVGGSCGMAVVGAVRVAAEFPDKLVVVILPDSGRNYLSKIFNDDWMASQGLI